MAASVRPVASAPRARAAGGGGGGGVRTRRRSRRRRRRRAGGCRPRQAAGRRRRRRADAEEAAQPPVAAGAALDAVAEPQQAVAAAELRTRRRRGGRGRRRRRWRLRCGSRRRRALRRRLLGFPSGPTSSLACATTSGAVCACDAEVASCVTVKAVVASSTMRRFVMMSLVPGKGLAATNGLHWHVSWSIERLIIRPDCGGLQMAGWFLFHWRNGLHAPLFIARSDGAFNHPVSRLIGGGIGRARAVRPAHRQFVRHLARQLLRLRWLAGLTHRRRHLGARVARRSSRGGSVGCPGVAGGISGGSIGITSPEVSTAVRQRRRPRCSRAIQKWNRQHGYAGAWQTASMLWPSGSSTNAP